MKTKFFKKTKIIAGFLGVLIVILCTITIMWIIHNHNHPDPKIYFSTSFDKGIDMYKSLDATWTPENNKSSNGIVTLSSNEYAAPYLMLPVTLSQNPSNPFVFYIKTYISSYTNEAVNLGTLIYPTGSISVITNQNDQIGFSNDLFSKPVYSKTSPIKKDSWNHIYTCIDTKKNHIYIYVNKSIVLSSEFKATVYPIQEIWLGSIWLYGTGQYGAPKNIKYSNVELGNKGIIPEPSWLEFTRNSIFDIFN